ncbi:MAG: hypothetical protein M3493_13995 [Actinomycetota bacterium]|nr:hypothetical protein [Euzebyaceae bacterium]MDQ3453782.1 hypothetical protein [Actinomycetota bacterium]
MSDPERSVDQYVRRLDGVEADRLAASWFDSGAKQALFEQIVSMPADTQPIATPRRGAVTARVPRKRLAVVAVATVMMLGAGGAFAAGVFSPDPVDVEAVTRQGDAAADVHLDGWRLELDAETVRCDYGQGEVIETWAAQGSLSQPLSIDHLVDECATGTDMATLDAASAVVCSAPRGNYLLPVVLNGGNCVTRGYDPVDEATLLAHVNHLREVEIAIRGITRHNECLVAADAERLVVERAEASGEDLDVQVSSDDGPCFAATVSWETQQILIAPPHG